MQSRSKHFDYFSFSSAELCGSAKDNILRSPVYVQSYPPNVHCVYNISVPHGKVQRLVFQIFELAFDPECRLEQNSLTKRVSNYSVLVNSVKINRENANYFWVKGKPEPARNGGLWSKDHYTKLWLIMSSSNYMLTGQEVHLIRTPMSVTVIGLQKLTYFTRKWICWQTSSGFKLLRNAGVIHIKNLGLILKGQNSSIT